ncbi:hypothetical protein ACIBI4_04535 [Streptomyces sp. NPDC050418]|uniref:hypothetical protein n=1 Tax=Streptomyces sp. NPDC050418 TaxID=3365612 RepID=UPI0037A908DC
MSDRPNLDAAWRRLTGWLQVNAPVSYAALLPPVPEKEIAAADANLRHHLGFELPAGGRAGGLSGDARHGGAVARPRGWGVHDAVVTASHDSGQQALRSGDVTVQARSTASPFTPGRVCSIRRAAFGVNS